MKISKLEIIARDRVNQPLYPYVKPTDYYLDILGEKSPTEAAMIDNVAILKMTADDSSSSYFNTSSLVADYALTLFRKIENWDASEIGMAWDFLYRYSLPLGRAGVSMHAISVINLMMYDLCRERPQHESGPARDSGEDTENGITEDEIFCLC